MDAEGSSFGLEGKLPESGRLNAECRGPSTALSSAFADENFAQDDEREGLPVRLLLFRYFEPVADAAEGFQVLGMAGVLFNLFAEAADVYVDGARGHERSFFPHRVEQLVA